MSLGAIGISSSGMRAASLRLDAAASNIANAGSTGRPPGPDGTSEAYRPVDVRQTAAPGGGVDATVVARDPPWAAGYDPSDPNAGPDGSVATPAVDMTAELTTVMRARIDYAAAAKVMKVASAMDRTLIDTFV